MLSEDCNCKPPAGHVKAKRVSGGRAAGSWGSARVGEVVMVPESVVAARPANWQVFTPKPVVEAASEAAVAAESLLLMTKRELEELAVQMNVDLPRKATKAQIVEALTNA